MSLNLTELVFQVDSTKVLEAKKSFVELAGALEGVSKAEEGRNKVAGKSRLKEQATEAENLAQAEDKVSKSLELQAKIAKYAQEGLGKVAARQLAVMESAGATAEQLKEFKSLLEKTNEVTKSSTKTTEDYTKAQKEQVSVTERARLVNEEMYKGWSKGDATLITRAKLLGEVTDKLEELLHQRRAVTADPFDQSNSGLERMTNATRQLSEAQRQLEMQTGLTSKQARELSDDKIRLTERYRAATGAAFDNADAQARLAQELNKLEKEYIAQANIYNSLVTQQKQHEQQVRETARAIKYLTTEDEKMQAALLDTNAALDKASTDKLVKYEQALRKSGLASDVQVQKLQAYRAELNKVQQQEQKRAEQHLSRALAPQITDIFVSLQGGMNPLTVLLQQGGQVVDLFRLSGLEADKMGQAMTNAFMSMIPSIKAVGKGVAELAGNLLMMPVNAVSNALGSVPLIAKMTEQLHASAAAGNIFALAMVAASKASRVLMATGIGTLVATLAGIAVGFVQATKEQDNWVRALHTGNNRLNLTNVELVKAASSYDVLGASTSKAAEALIEISNNSKLTADDVGLVMKSAIDLERYGGVAISETVKRYSEMREKPVEAMTELIKTTGDLSAATILFVQDLKEKEGASVAAAYALEQMAARDKKVIEGMKQELSIFATFVKDLGAGISNFFSHAFKQIWYASDSSVAIGAALDRAKAQLKSFEEFEKNNPGASYDDSAKKRIQQQIKDLEAKANVYEVERKKQAELQDQERKRALDLETSLGIVKSGESEVNKLLSQQKELRKSLDSAASRKEQELHAQAMAVLEEKIAKAREKEAKEANKKTPLTPDLKGLELYNDLMNNAKGYTKEYNNQVELLNASLNSQKITQEQYNEALKVLNSQQPFSTKAKRDATKAEKEYEKTLKEQQKALESLNIIQEAMNSDSETVSERILKVQSRITKEYKLQPKAVKDTLPSLEEMLQYAVDTDRAVQRYRENLEKINLEHKHQLEAISEQSNMIDDQLKIAFMNTEDAKNYTREKEKQVKHAKALRDYEQAIADIRKQLKGGDPKEIHAKELEAYKVFTAEKQLIDREYASKYTEDFIKEFQSVKSNITDVISTALFEGGKEGRKKLVDILKQNFKMKVTAVIDNVVGQGLNAFLSLATNGTVGGSSGSILNTVNNASSLNTLYGAGSQLLFGGAAGASTASLGYANAVGAVGGDSLGALISANGGWSGVSTGGAASGGMSAMVPWWALAAVAGMFASNKLYERGYSEKDLDWKNPLNWASKGGTKVMESLGISDKVINILNGAPLVSYLNERMGLQSTPHIGAGAIYSGGALQEGQGIYNRGTFGMGTASEYNAEAQSSVSSIISTAGFTLDVLSKALGNGSKFSVQGAYADDRSKDGAWGSLKIVDELGNVLVDWAETATSKWAPKIFSNGEEGWKEWTNAVTADMFTAIKNMDIASWAKAMFGAIPEDATNEDKVKALQEVGAQVGLIILQFKELGKNLVGFKNITGDMQTALINASGGMEALVSNAEAYYQSFYTESERMQNLRSQVNSALNDLGVSLGSPLDAFAKDAKEQFRKHLEEAMSTDQGELAGKMLALAGAFAQAADYAQSAEGALSGFTDVLEMLSGSGSSLRTAGELLDNIATVMNKAKTFAPKLEQGLWNTLGKGSASQTISAATDLFGIVQEKIQLEKQAYQEQIQEQQSAANEILSAYKSQYSWAVSLREYTKSLLIGDKSPLTTAQKLAQATQQYQETLNKAQAGDQDAATKLQSAADSYLELARVYYASGDQYTSVFDTVYGQLSQFSANALSESERQIAIAEQQLQSLVTMQEQDYQMSSALQEELRRLYEATEIAYSIQEQEYIKEAEKLNLQIQALDSMSQKLDVLHSIDYGILALSSALGVGTLVNGSHANGLSNVPFDGYVAELHKGERVLTAQENRSYSQGSSFNDKEIKALRQDVKNLESALVQALNRNTQVTSVVTEKQTTALVKVQEQSAREAKIQEMRKQLA